MTTHPVFAAIPDVTAPVKDDVRDLIETRFPLILTSASEITAMDLPQTPVVMLSGYMFLYDSADSTTAHDGVWCLVSHDSRRYKRPGKKRLASDVTNNNGTPDTLADVTALSFAVLSGHRYRFKFFIVYTAAATTTGSRWSINGPSITTLHYRSTYSLTATSQTVNEGLAAYNLPAAANASSAATGSNIAIIEGEIQPSADGTVIARFASEVASSAIVAKANFSYVEVEEIP